ncbi:rhamnan synthesis F family protein [Azorhizobium doebereinerae]|uniref:rhamnan synthesis F family protein n=1 Tax=Azorhizobium doebereinerae TaxID=281091 RepID=UPI0004103CD1|nr:rhamnan synthesis F family protein [Azorhizobium doebereinerae]
MSPVNPTRVARHLLTAGAKVFAGFDPSPNLRKALGLLAAPELGEEILDDRDLNTLRRRVVRPLGTVDKRPVCLFAAYSPDGRIWPHVTNYCRDLKAAGFRTVLIVATDRADLRCYDPGPSVADAMLVVENFGYDFSAWARTLRLWPDLWSASALLFANDSVYHSPTALTALMERVKRSAADVVALTESTAFRRHFQSYFFLLREKALAHEAVQAFFSEIRALGDKQKVIEACEVPLPSLLATARLEVDVLFPLPENDPRAANPTLAAWHDLLRSGLPFVKVQLLRDNPMNANIGKWRADLTAAGFRVEEVEMHLGSIKIPAAAFLQP